MIGFFLEYEWGSRKNAKAGNWKLKIKYPRRWQQQATSLSTPRKQHGCSLVVTS